MKNFPIYKDGREYWISRSVCVVVLIIAEDDDHILILIEKRGPKTPDPEYVGKWCIPCGYVDYNETIAEAASREVFEETGLHISPDKFQLCEVVDDPRSDKRQNISFRYLVDLRDEYLGELCDQLNNNNSEDGEVSELRFINLYNINDYEWAFNHNVLIRHMLTND